MLFSYSAQGSEPEYIQIRERPSLELVVSGGIAMQSGYLTQKDSVGAYGIDLNMGLGKGLLAFSWQGFSADHDTSEFALANGKSVSVTTFAFVPYVNLAQGERWSLLGGIGFTQVSLYQENPEYSVSYGTFTLSGVFRYALSPRWSVQYKNNWYDVEQTIAGQKTTFQVWNHLIGAGYSFY